MQVSFEDVIAPVPGSRIKILDSPVASPGFCVICRSGNPDGRKYIDFDFDLDWYGAVYICGHCLTEATHYLGWLNPEEHRKLHYEYTQLADRLNKLEAENAKLRTALSLLDFLGTAVSDADSSNAASSQGDREEQSKSAGNIKEPAIADSAGKSKSAGSADKRGRKDVPGNESDNDGSESGFELSIE